MLFKVCIPSVILINITPFNVFNEIDILKIFLLHYIFSMFLTHIKFHIYQYYLLFYS